MKSNTSVCLQVISITSLGYCFFNGRDQQHGPCSFKWSITESRNLRINSRWNQQEDMRNKTHSRPRATGTLVRVGTTQTSRVRGKGLIQVKRGGRGHGAQVRETRCVSQRVKRECEVTNRWVSWRQTVVIKVCTVSEQPDPERIVLLSDVWVHVAVVFDNRQIQAFILTVLLSIKPVHRLVYELGIIPVLFGTDEEEMFCTAGAVKPFKKKPKNKISKN